MSEEMNAAVGYDALRTEIARLRLTVMVLAVALVGCVVWLALRKPALPAVLTAERLNIVEPDGNLAFVLANSQRPVAATMDGKPLMRDQEEERKGIPSFVFFDGKGDEVGGMLLGVTKTPDGYSASRHLSLDGYKQDQTVVLAHYQSPAGSSAGLRISDRPQNLSLLDAFGQLGLQAGASRADMQAAIQALPEDTRAVKMRELFGVSRLFLGSDQNRNASLVMRDGEGRPRILIEVPATGEPSIRVLDAGGNDVLKLPS